jgi:hypothetical protein
LTKSSLEEQHFSKKFENHAPAASKKVKHFQANVVSTEGLQG